MDYVLFLLDLAAGTKQHLRLLIVQKAKCIMYQKISLECPAGEQLHSGLRFTLFWWARRGIGWGPVYLSVSPGSSRKSAASPSWPSWRPSRQLVYPGELHYSNTSPSLLHFSPAHSSFTHQPTNVRAHTRTHTHKYTHITHTMFFKCLHICMHIYQSHAY